MFAKNVSQESTAQQRPLADAVSYYTFGFIEGYKKLYTDR